MTTNAFDRETGFKVARKRCDECLFSSNKIVDDERRDAILAECRRDETYFICHKATKLGRGVVCRGFYDTEANRSCQVATRLGLTRFVDPEENE